MGGVATEQACATTVDRKSRGFAYHGEVSRGLLSSLSACGSKLLRCCSSSCFLSQVSRVSCLCFPQAAQLARAKHDKSSGEVVVGTPPVHGHAHNKLPLLPISRCRTTCQTFEDVLRTQHPRSLPYPPTRSQWCSAYFRKTPSRFADQDSSGVTVPSMAQSMGTYIRILETQQCCSMVNDRAHDTEESWWVQFCSI